MTYYFQISLRWTKIQAQFLNVFSSAPDMILLLCSVAYNLRNNNPQRSWHGIALGERLSPIRFYIIEQTPGDIPKKDLNLRCSILQLSPDALIDIERATVEKPDAPAGWKDVVMEVHVMKNSKTALLPFQRRVYTKG